jgi:histidinol-phosphate/aromatic aminotransferase/cobyric acid decarboxylase-like protein/choline kinase
MQALILAAGMGKRLGKLSLKNTKCMIEVNGVKLIDRLLDSLEQVGINDIGIVVGHGAKPLTEYILATRKIKNLVFISNELYKTTNNIFSLHRALDFFKQDDTILFESDVIFETEMLAQLIRNQSPNLVAVGSFRPWMDGTVVEIDNMSLITEFVPKSQIDLTKKSYYKTVNIYKFSKEFINSKYSPFLEAYIDAMGNNEYYEEVLRVITSLPRHGLQAFICDSFDWYEIDDQHDLAVASTIFSNFQDKYSAYQSRYGGFWRFEHLLDYCYLVNPFFPPEKLVKELQSALPNAIKDYPSTISIQNQLIASLLEINPEYVTSGNGASEFIPGIKSILKSGVIGLLSPGFDEYHSRLEDCEVKFLNLFYPNYEEALESVRMFAKEVDTLLIVNPNNPTGFCFKKLDLIQIIEDCKSRNVNVILDESFIDFSDEGVANSLLEDEILSKYDNLLVIKSISKSYGIAGIRLGACASSNENFLKDISREIPVWNINSIAEIFLQRVGKYVSEYASACLSISRIRVDFILALTDLGFLVYPSQANFIMVKIPEDLDPSFFSNSMIDNNILIKNLDKKRGIPGTGFFRIAIKDQHDNSIFIAACKRVFRELRDQNL